MKDYTENTYIFIGLSLRKQTAIVTITCESRKPGETFCLLGRLILNVSI